MRKFLAKLGLGSSSAGAGGPPRSIAADAAKSATWIAQALVASGYRTDFTIDSLREIDRFIDDHAPGGKPRPNGLLGEQTGARIFAIGAYVGEVIRRKHGGAWHVDDENDPAAEIKAAIRLPSGGMLWPIQRVLKRIKNGGEDSILAYGQWISEVDAR